MADQHSGRRSSLNVVKSTPGNYYVPEEVEKRLTEFTAAYLARRPENIWDFGIEFFQRLVEQEELDPTQNNQVTEVYGVQYGRERRETVCAEPYDPTEDKEFKVVLHAKTAGQKERIMAAIKHNFLFRGLEQDQISQVVGAMYERKVIPGEIIITQGDDGDNFYVIEKGKYSVLIKAEEDDTFGEILIGNYEDEGSFGEVALMYNQPRTASVRADSHGILWVMERSLFRKIVLRTAFLKVSTYQDLLDKVPMFSELSQYEKIKLADVLVSHTYSPGENIIHQGDKADGMYFVEKGTVSITHEQGGIKKEVNQIKAGGYFGELALVTHKPRAATATAVDQVKLAFISVDAFERLLGPCLKIMKRNAESYEKQLIKLFGSNANVTDIRWA